MINYRLVVAGVMIAFAVAELVTGKLLHRDETRPKDVILELASGLAVPLLIIPMILLAAPWLVEQIAPGSENAWASWPGWLMFLVLLLADDLTQYWWHRLSHRYPRLYALHRAHHSARYLSIRIVYRNNLIYYALMPGLWLSAALIHLGFGPVYVVYIIAKMTVIIGAHSSVPWDAPLLRHRWTQPLMWLVERVISTPATHAAHHGRHEADGVTHYKGNYGNFLFLWDVIFGTAKITRRRPDSYGLENVAPASWFEELLWPFGGAARHAQSKRAQSKRAQSKRAQSNSAQSKRAPSNANTPSMASSVPTSAATSVATSPAHSPVTPSPNDCTA